MQQLGWAMDDSRRKVGHKVCSEEHCMLMRYTVGARGRGHTPAVATVGWVDVRG